MTSKTADPTISHDVDLLQSAEVKVEQPIEEPEVQNENTLDDVVVIEEPLQAQPE